MRYLLYNILLAFLWMTITGIVNTTNFIVGFVLSYITLWLFRSNLGHSNYFIKFYQVARLLISFAKEILVANFYIACEIVTPRYITQSAIIKYRLDAQNDLEIALLTNLITLTPGTLCMEVTEDRNYVFIHTMYHGELRDVERGIKENIEKKLLEALR